MRTSTKIGLIILLLGIVMVLPQGLVSAQGEPTISAINPLTQNSNFIFYTNTTFVGSRFNVTLSVNNGTGVASWQVGIIYNTTILNATRAWIPVADPAYIFYTKGDLPVISLTPTVAQVGDITVPPSAVTFTSAKKLATVEFEVMLIPPKGEGNKLSTTLDINQSYTYLLDIDTNEIPIVRTSGNYELNWVKPGSQISLSASPGTATLGSGVTLSGSISAPSNTSATFPDVPVTIWHRVGTSGAITNLTTVTTNTTGGYSFSWTSAGVGTHQFHSSWEGNADYQRANSSVVSVTVNKITTSITLTASSASIKLGENTTLTGQITPALSGVSIRLVIGTNNNITTVTTSATGSFTYLWKPDAAGSFDLKAVYDGDATHSNSESTAVTVAVEAPPPTTNWYYYVIAAIVIVVIIIVIAWYLMRRRSQK